MTAHLLTVGDEILIGQIVDTNSSWMAQQLNLIGASVVKKSSVSDDLEAIQAGIREGFAAADVVLMTGGLGPTKDDVTKKAIADFFGVELKFDQPTYDRIVRIFEQFGRTIKESHRIQCFLPSNATILFNKMGTAPGMWFEHKGKVLVSMPGVPYEMKYLMEYEVIPNLQKRFPGRPVAHRTILTVGVGESDIADRIADFEDSLPPHIKLAYLPNLGQVRVRLSGTAEDLAALNQELDEKAKELSDIIPEIIFGYDTEQLEAVIGQMLRKRGLKLGIAESCTGGYLAHRITSIPGSSDYFMGGLVPYTNDLKMKLLDVKSDTLEQFGAVSEQTVIEMVQGALPLLETDIAIAASGIAGPGGGTEEKPVGLVWIAVGNKEKIVTHKILSGKDRDKNIHFAAIMALNVLRQFVTEQYVEIVA